MVLAIACIAIILIVLHNGSMPKLLCFLCLAFFSLPLFPFGRSEKSRTNSAASNKIENNTETVQPDAASAENSKTSLIGTDQGLFSVDSKGKTSALWQGGAVKKILFVPAKAGAEIQGQGFWILLGSEGITISNDLKNWEARNQGLPVKTIKIFENNNKSFLQMTQEIKDLEINPANSNEMVCATKDRVYLSRDQGQSWLSVGMPTSRTNGVKAVALADMPTSGGRTELTVFVSQAVYGIYYMQPDLPGAQWTEMSRGIEKLETTDNADEVSDIAVRLVPGTNDTGPSAEIFISQTFRRRIYRLDWEKKLFISVWSDNSVFGTVDSLNVRQNELGFLYEGTVASLVFPDFSFRKHQDVQDYIRSVSAQGQMHCIAIQDSKNDENVTFNELWLLDEEEPGIIAEKSASLSKAANKEGLYLPVNHAMESERLEWYLDTIQKTGLNMVVIDMKDDYGRLRFTPKNPAISERGRVFRPLDINAFLKTMKEKGIYTVARIVVFKDPVLAGKENSRFAVWDSRNNRPWAGYYDSRRKKADISDADRRNELLQFFEADDPEYEIVRTFYDERWVDPYSEEVWKYTADIASELYEQGFDEIQFDYIRFPTDGQNLGNARYRWQENGMDMESAILSFLRHIRSNVKAPVSIDIYGANGWYRTGARTGQEVELLAPWVDVICPMYYPSHFEQGFLAQAPMELRPWRIYFHGTLRTARIARGQVIIRPYVQAFYLNVSYDRRFYNPDYVRREIEGVREAGFGGLTHWNNSGRYEDIPFKQN